MKPIEHIPDDGTSVRTDCPYCGRKDTFTVTNLGDCLIYNCYSIFCTGSSGKMPLKEGVASKANRLYKRLSRPKPESDVFTVPDHWEYGLVNSVAREYAERTHQMPAIEAGIFMPYYDTLYNRYVFPIRDAGGAIVGGVGRSMASGAYSKSWNYNRKLELPFVCKNTGDTAILVEDCASAVAATRRTGLVGIALLGTFLRDAYIPHLKGYSKIIVALDADARKKGLDICKKLGVYYDNVEFMLLTKDIKDLEEF